MERNDFWQNVANGINAAIKVRNLHNSTTREGNSLIGPSGIHILSEMLKTIIDYSPVQYKDSLRKSIDRSTSYSNAYRNLEHHLRSANRENFGTTELIKTLELMKPLVPNHHKSVIEKIKKIYDIVYS